MEAVQMELFDVYNIDIRGPWTHPNIDNRTEISQWLSDKIDNEDVQYLWYDRFNIDWMVIVDMKRVKKIGRVENRNWKVV